MGIDALTDREWAMLLMCVKGATREEAGREYGIGEAHASNIIRSAVVKLGARDVAHAFAIGLAVGFYRLSHLHDLEVPQQAREAALRAEVEMPEETREALEKGRRDWAEVNRQWAEERAEIRRLRGY